MTVDNASRLVFLHELHKFKVDTKVRFICCTLEYDPATGLLLVEHAYNPAAAADKTETRSSQIPRAYVDVNLVIETANSELFQPGAWINVIGYVQPLPLPAGPRQQSLLPTSSASSLATTSGTTMAPTHTTTAMTTLVNHPRIQAILVWDAGPLKISDYETSVEKHRAALSDARQVFDQFQS